MIEISLEWIVVTDYSIPIKSYVIFSIAWGSRVGSGAFGSMRTKAAL